MIMRVIGASKHEKVYQDVRLYKTCKSSRLCMQEQAASIPVCRSFYNSVLAHGRLPESSFN